MSRTKGGRQRRNLHSFASRSKRPHIALFISSIDRPMFMDVYFRFRIYEILGSLWHNKGETFSNIKDGPYRPGVGHINRGPYIPGAISTGIRPNGLALE